MPFTSHQISTHSNSKKLHKNLQNSNFPSLSSSVAPRFQDATPILLHLYPKFGFLHSFQHSLNLNEPFHHSFYSFFYFFLLSLYHEKKTQHFALTFNKTKGVDLFFSLFFNFQSHFISN
ncbi:unnamed protein product [Vicia faba]|uniref:Uncharacterized protein n=1 Tax=Vicia faba TaxID=3906 RepID=A0AAV1AYN1_VICFA|nr:unnamed protein product [Vicia faba]